MVKRSAEILTTSKARTAKNEKTITPHLPPQAKYPPKNCLSITLQYYTAVPPSPSQICPPPRSSPNFCPTTILPVLPLIRTNSVFTSSSPSRYTADRGQTPCRRGSGDGGGGVHGDGEGGHGDGHGALRCANDDQFHCNYHRSPGNTKQAAHIEHGSQSMP